jgi:hypothetical protein
MTHKRLDPYDDYDAETMARIARQGRRHEQRTFAERWALLAIFAIGLAAVVAIARWATQ